MARKTKNRMVETGDAGFQRETTTNGQAIESENARLREIGGFRQDNVAASQTGVALTYQGVDATAPVGKVMARAGKIVGLAWQLSAAITAGVATIRATINGTAVGDTVSIKSASTTSAVVDQAAEVAFNEGDILGVKVTTDGSASPTTSELNVDLTVRLAAGGSPNS